MLSLLTEAAALLTLGLVQRWGEVVPRWVPFLGGRTVPATAATIPAAVGATTLTALWTQMLLWWQMPHDDLTATGATVIGILYLPLVAWPASGGGHHLLLEKTPVHKLTQPHRRVR